MSKHFYLVGLAWASYAVGVVSALWLEHLRASLLVFILATALFWVPLALLCLKWGDDWEYGPRDNPARKKFLKIWPKRRGGEL